MAKYKSIVRIRGDASGLNFYTRNGKTFLRNQTSLDRERILSDPTFKRTRENMREFGAAATIAATVRHSMGRRVVQVMADSNMTARLQAEFRRILAKGPGRRGERVFDLGLNLGLLVGFEFNAGEKFNEVNGAPFTATINADRNQVTVDFPAFDPEQENHIPEGATHFRYVLGIASCSIYEYDADSNRYESIVPSQNGLGDTQFSATMPVGAAIAAPFSLVAALPGAPVLTVDVHLIICLGIQYLQEVNGDFYILSQSNAMRIIGVA